MKKILTAVIIGLIFSLIPCTAYAGDMAEIIQSTIPQGTIGSNMTVSFKIQTDDSTFWEKTRDVYVGASIHQEFVAIDEATPSDYHFFPFEITSEMEQNQGYFQHVGSVGKNANRSASLSMKLRRDIPEGYYTFEIELYDGNPVGNTSNVQLIGYGELRIWAKKSASTKEEKEDLKTVTWELGEGQMTPYAVYPEICNFTLNLRNSGTIGALDVTASIICDSDSEKFPYDINETNYNRHFDLIKENETVALPYSFAIRSNVYTGYYPIKMEITYRESSSGELKKEEKTFFVHIKNKDKEAEKKQNEFNANDRVKARIIIDSYRTEPADVYAGNDYTLYVTFKNASKSVDASNVLLTFDSEKVSESPVFTTSGGSNSVVIDTLKAEETAEVSMHFTAGASVDQRSYAINVSEKYDSPEFKNAEEKVSLTVPVLQVAKFNMGNVEVMPSSISVGEESNVMFAINNTGKVILYNVMVKFEDASISTTESYIGNIKPGSSANVDAMISGVAPTTGDGHVKTSISYEDEYGNLTVTDKDVILYVNEAFEMPENFDIPVEIPVEEPWYQKKYVKWGGAGAVLLLAIVIFLRRRKKKKEF